MGLLDVGGKWEKFGGGFPEMAAVRVGGEFGRRTIGGTPHYGTVTDIDGDVVYVRCRYHGKECCTRLREEERNA